MRKRLTLAALLLAVPALAPADIKYGLWSFDTQTSMPNMPKMPANMPKLPPGVKLPPGMSMPQFSPEGMKMSFQHCISKDQLVPKNDRNKEDCKIDKLDQKGDSVNATMTCNTPHGKLNGVFAATYSGDTMSSTMDISGGEHGMQMHQQTTGKYLGPCTK